MDEIIIDYEMVVADNPVTFVTDVKKKIREGWEPYGPAFSTRAWIFCQTMVKYDDE